MKIVNQFRKKFGGKNINRANNIKKLTQNSKNNNAKNGSKIIYFIFCLAFFSVFFFGVKRYIDFINEKTKLYQEIANHIASTYEGFLNYSQLLLNSVNHEILKSKSFGEETVEILSSIDRVKNQNNVANQWFFEGMLYWIDSNKYLIASSAGKVLKPIDLSSRDYLEKTEIEPSKLQVGKVIVGALSGNNVLPIAVGVVGKKGYHLGTSVLSVKVETLIDKFYLTIGAKNAGNFAIITNEGEVILESNKKYFIANKSVDNGVNKPFFKGLKNIKNYKFTDKNAVISKFNILKKSGNLIVASKILDFPFIVLYKVENKKIYQEVFVEILPYLIQTLFLLLFLAFYLSRSRLNVKK